MLLTEAGKIYLHVAGAAHRGDLVQGDDERPMNPHELSGGKHLLHALHRHMRDERLLLRSQENHHVILHSLDEQDIVELHLPEGAVDLEEGGRLRFGNRSRRDRRSRRRFLQREPFPRLLRRLQELLVTDGLEQEIQGGNLVTLERILLESRREDDARAGGNHPGQLHAAQIRHLDVQEHQVRSLRPHLGQRQDRVGKRRDQLQKRRAGDEILQHLDGEGLVVHDKAAEGGHKAFRVTCT